MGQPFRMVKFQHDRRARRRRQSAAGCATPAAFRPLPARQQPDELPELWNVLKGDMSLVGPRPLLMEYLPLYTPEQARRHEVRGITGWAQINGRNAIGWEEKFRLDVWYVDHRSLLLDLRIVALTIAHATTTRRQRTEQRDRRKFTGSPR